MSSHPPVLPVLIRPPEAVLAYHAHPGSSFAVVDVEARRIGIAPGVVSILVVVIGQADFHGIREPRTAVVHIAHLREQTSTYEECRCQESDGSEYRQFKHDFSLLSGESRNRHGGACVRKVDRQSIGPSMTKLRHPTFLICL
jgi:hypothetical protein